MRVVLKENLVEALIGVLVVAVAAWFIVFAYGRTGGGARAGSYQVAALFNDASGVGVGTDVRVAGMTVGQVVASSLDPETWQARLTLSIDPKVSVPADSSAVITSEGIMGGSFVALVPGGDPVPLKDGDLIIDTQGSVDLLSMIGQFINQSGGIGKNGNGGGNAADDAAGAMADTPMDAAPSAEPALPATQ